MNPHEEILFSASAQSKIDQMVQSALAFPSIRTPSHTTAYQVYAMQTTSQRKAYQMRTHQQTPRLIEK